MEPADKVISLHIPELSSIVRGKVGKKVEFGLNWGFTRLRGGFLLARLALNRRELQDTKYAVEAVKDRKALFGKAPRAYGYDRAGYSAKNTVSSHYQEPLLLKRPREREATSSRD
jgi:hypothetical protein